MRDPLERVSVILDGMEFSGWSRLAITLAVNVAARSAQLTISDFAGAMPFLPGAPCTILASGDLILTGYVRDVSPQHDERRHEVTLGISSRAIDAVEASIVHPTGFVKDKDLVGIAKEFDTGGVGIVASEGFPVEKASFVNTGHSLFHHLEPLARSHGAFLYDTAEGELRIAKAPRGRHAGALSIGNGGNIIAASAKFTEAGRHSPVIVRGQSSRGTGAGALRLEARANDPAVRRFRPRVVVHESEATSQKLMSRAERQVRRAAGLSHSAQLTVAGWRDQAGQLFEPHFLIKVTDPRIYCDQVMGLQSVTLMQDIAAGGPGTRASLTLVDPSALNGEPGDGQGPGDEMDWSADPDVTIDAE